MNIRRPCQYCVGLDGYIHAKFNGGMCGNVATSGISSHGEKVTHATCTRLKGHKGDHVACLISFRVYYTGTFSDLDASNHEYMRWPNKEEDSDYEHSVRDAEQQRAPGTVVRPA